MFENLEVVLEPSNAGDNYDFAGPDAIYDIIIEDLKQAIEVLPKNGQAPIKAG